MCTLQVLGARPVHAYYEQMEHSHRISHRSSNVHASTKLMLRSSVPTPWEHQRSEAKPLPLGYWLQEGDHDRVAGWNLAQILARSVESPI